MRRAASLFDLLEPAAAPLAAKLPAGRILHPAAPPPQPLPVAPPSPVAPPLPEPPQPDIAAYAAGPGDDDTDLALALRAWREAGAVRGQAADWMFRLERVSAAAEWTAALDRAHAAIRDLMAALADVQTASGQLAHAQFSPSQQEETNDAV